MEALLDVAKELIQANPLFKDKLEFPILVESRLHSLYTQSLRRQQHPPQQEKNLMSNPFPFSFVSQQEENLMSYPFGLRPVPAGSAYRNIQNNDGVASFGKYQNSENAWLKLAKEVDEVTTIRINEIKEQGQCRSLRLPEKLECDKISRLMYANSGRSILALASNAMHLLWKWDKTEVSSSVRPEIWEPKSGKMMVNDIEHVTNEDTEACFSMSNNEAYLISTSGGKISVFSTATFERLNTFMPPSLACTCLIFYTEDNNILVIGPEDSNILIYDIRKDMMIKTLKGNLKKITGLAYSEELKVLVSLDAEAQICVWKWGTWVKQNTAALQIPSGRNSASAIRVQYQNDQIHFLVVHPVHLAIYETTNLNCVKQVFSAHITDATLSSESEMIFASFLDATLLVFGVANFEPVCRTQPSAYLHAISSPSVYPTAIDAHTTKNQFAIGLSDGGVCVIEPLNSAKNRFAWETTDSC
ncbi:topless-related protein 1-like [Papaver somniferum]|uniref:topless-related protein 1-like n=1 Tax=Papaver somniferum TaxID=3469 RepID=UPI000E704DCF|nr:topless-related protein 1-like [Papaver somniferum]